MSKSTLTRALLLAGVFAAAGVAQAQTGVIHTPAETAIVGAAPATVTTYTYTTTYPVVTYSAPAPVVTYAPPVVSYVPDTVVTQVHRPDVVSRSGPAATFNVPSRAGEASTMTGGAPNMATSNDFVINHSH